MWASMQLQLIPEDNVVRPFIHQGGLTHDDAKAQVRELLAGFAKAAPTLTRLVNLWDQGAPEDTVYFGPFAIAAVDEDHVEDWIEVHTRRLREHLAPAPAGHRSGR